jgi:YHS domain-containing protein
MLCPPSGERFAQTRTAEDAALFAPTWSGQWRRFFRNRRTAGKSGKSGISAKFYPTCAAALPKTQPAAILRYSFHVFPKGTTGMCAFSRFLAAGGLTLLAASWTSGADAVRWESDFETAMQKAAQQNRLVLVHFFNDGCLPCAVVDRQVFPSPQVAQAVHTSYVPVKVHAGQRPDLAQRFGVRAWPTDVVVTPAGQKVAQHVSPQDPIHYSQMVSQIAGREQGRFAAAPQGMTPTPNGQVFAQQQQARPPFGAQPTTADDRNSTFPLSSNNVGRVGYETQAGGEFPLNRNQANSQPAPQTQNDFASAYRGSPFGQPQSSSHQGSNASPFAGQFSPNTSPYGGVSVQPGMDAGRTAATPDAARTAALASQMRPPSSMGSSAIPAGPQFGAAPGIGAQATPPGMVQNNPFMTSSTGNAPAQVGPSPSNPQLAANVQPPAAGAPAMNVAPNSPPPSAPGGPKFALDGYCVVSLVEQLSTPGAQPKWTAGDPRWGAVHRGQTYLFAGPAEQQKFLANPDYFTPILSGYDPVAFIEGGQLIEGRRAHGFIHDGKIYMFSSEESLQRFWGARDMYIARVQQAMTANANQQRR